MKIKRILSLLLSVLLLLSVMTGCSLSGVQEVIEQGKEIYDIIENGEYVPSNADVGDFRADMYDGEPFMHINDGVPHFTDEEKSQTKVFEKYSDLDKLGRCGVAYACLGKELMPTEDRESLSSVTPSGWKNKQYDIK